MKTYLVNIYLDGRLVEYNAEVTGSNEEQAKIAIVSFIPLGMLVNCQSGGKLSIEITEKP